MCDEIEDAAHHFGVLVFKETGLDDERHVQWAKNFGELDSILQFVKPGAKTRLAPYYDLWDAGNLDVNGDIIPRSSHQYEYNKVALWYVNRLIDRETRCGMLIIHPNILDIRTRPF